MVPQFDTARSKKDTIARFSCKECGAGLLTHPLDKDKAIYIWCRQCGLVYDPKHSMGKTIKTLIRYMKKKEFDHDERKHVMGAYDAYGLRAARIMTGKILRHETMFAGLKKEKSVPEPDDDMMFVGPPEGAESTDHPSGIRLTDTSEYGATKGGA